MFFTAIVKRLATTIKFVKKMYAGPAHFGIQFETERFNKTYVYV